MTQIFWVNTVTADETGLCAIPYLNKTRLSTHDLKSSKTISTQGINTGKHELCPETIHLEFYFFYENEELFQIF